MPRTQIEKLWIGGAVIVGLLVAAIGYFLLISPQRNQTGQLRAQLGDAQLQNDGLQARIDALDSQRARMASYRHALTAAQAALPVAGDKTATPALLRSLQTIANSTATRLSSVTVGAPQGLAPSAPAVATAPAAQPSSSGATSGAPVALAPPPPQMYSVPITAKVTGSLSQLKAFLTQLQGVQPRAVLLTAVTVSDEAPAATTTQRTTGSRTALSLTMDVFETPPTSAATEMPAGTTAGPTSGTASPAPTPAASGTP